MFVVSITKVFTVTQRNPNETISAVMNEIQLHKIDLNLLVVFEALMVESSVAGAAVKLNKTPSAVSHALARLRDQVGDPLMVKVGGKMQASPFALQLIDDVRPILNSIKRVLRLPEPFDPASTARTFRIACPISATVLSTVMNNVQLAAPKINIDWLQTPTEVYAAVSEGHIDLEHLGGERRLPDGLDWAEMPPMEFISFIRNGHPAIADWGEEAWYRHGHIKVASVATDIRSPVDEVAPKPGTERRIAARISEFSAVGPLVAESDLIVTLPPVVMASVMETYGLVPLRPLMRMDPFHVRFFWSSRMANDPALVWIREIVLDAYRVAHEDATALVTARLGEETMA
nr:LysR family transcriptional regulator [Marivita sp. S6314]